MCEGCVLPGRSVCVKVVSCCSNLPGRGFSKIPLETTSITMGEIMEKVLRKRRLRQREGETQDSSAGLSQALSLAACPPAHPFINEIDIKSDSL